MWYAFIYMNFEVESLKEIGDLYNEAQLSDFKQSSSSKF